METENYLTIPQAAKELGLAESTIHNALYEGRIAFVKLLGRKAIARAEVDRYRARTQPEGTKMRGRPAGSKNQTKMGMNSR